MPILENNETLISKVNEGDKQAIIEALNSGVPFPAFRAILQAGDLNLNDDDGFSGLRLWLDCDIRILGRKMKTYASATLFHLGQRSYNDLTEEELFVAEMYDSFHLV